jgi:drug/metabolite transporter (DMT)-like permease
VQPEHADALREDGRTRAEIAAAKRAWSDRLLAPAFVLLWCTGYPAGKIAVLHGGPFTVLLFRFAIAAAIFGALALFARVERPTRSALIHSAVIGFLSLACSFGGVYTALSLGVSTGISALFIGAMPLSTALFATVLGERLSRRQWIGLMLGFTGVFLVLEGRFGSGATAIGYLACAFGLVTLTIGTLYQKRFSGGIDMRVGLAVQHAAAALAMLPFAAFAEHFAHDGSVAYVGAIGWIVLVNAVGGFALLYLLLRRGEATDVAALFYLVPPVTAFMGFVVLGERLTLPMLPGFALAAAGVWLGTRRTA